MNMDALTAKMKYGKEIIELPINLAKGIAELSERLAWEHFKGAAYGTQNLRRTLSEIYLMGFLHAFDAGNRHE